MPVAKKVLSFSTESWIPCCWNECEKPGYELYKAVLHEHARTLACDDPRSSHCNFIFCSERHLRYYTNSHNRFGQLPPGFRKAI